MHWMLYAMILKHTYVLVNFQQMNEMNDKKNSTYTILSAYTERQAHRSPVTTHRLAESIKQHKWKWNRKF